MFSGEVMINYLIIGLIKKILLYKMTCFSEPYTRSKNKKKLNQTCLIMQRSLTNATEVDTSKFAEKADLPNLKSDTDKLNIDKLEKKNCKYNCM